MEKIVNYGVEDIERILIDVKQCKQFFITKNGQLYSLKLKISWNGLMVIRSIAYLKWLKVGNKMYEI